MLEDFFGHFLIFNESDDSHLTTVQFFWYSLDELSGSRIEGIRLSKNPLSRFWIPTTDRRSGIRSRCISHAYLICFTCLLSFPTYLLSKRQYQFDGAL
jgi:hypothetical protein